MAGNKIYVQGSYIDVHDNENVYLNVDKAEVKITPTPNPSPREVRKSDEKEISEELVEKLKPIFYNNEADVRLFVREITGMKPGDITDLVNRWVNDKRISNYGRSRKGELWEILNEADLYPKSRQNWNRRVY